MLEGPEEVPAEGGKHEQEHQNYQGETAGQQQPDVRLADQTAEYLLYDHVGGEEERDRDGEGEEGVGPSLLRGAGHELRVVDAEK